jgi:hypothetical protein
LHFLFLFASLCAAFFDLSLALSSALLARSSDFRFRSSSLFRLLSSLSFFSCSFNSASSFFFSFSFISNAAVPVSKRARGGGPQGVEAAGATKNLERALSFSLLELVAREGELVDKCVEVEAEKDAPPDAGAEEHMPPEENTGVRQTSKVTGDCDDLWWAWI